MISLDEAYELFKKHADSPISMIMENKDSFLASGGVIDKVTGEGPVSLQTTIPWFLCLDNMGYSEIFCGRLIDDYLNYIKHNGDSEIILADLYARAWNKLFYDKRGYSAEEYRSYEDYQKIISAWTEIERILYESIRNIMDKEEIHYPPCVQNRLDDPFYRIKAFMIRNGWTDNDINKTWVKYART